MASSGSNGILILPMENPEARKLTGNMLESLAYPTVYHAVDRVKSVQQTIQQLRHMLRQELDYKAEPVMFHMPSGMTSARTRSALASINRIIDEQNKERASPEMKRYAVRRICRQIRHMRGELRRANDYLASMQKAA